MFRNPTIKQKLSSASGQYLTSTSEIPQHVLFILEIPPKFERISNKISQNPSNQTSPDQKALGAHLVIDEQFIYLIVPHCDWNRDFSLMIYIIEDFT